MYKGEGDPLSKTLRALLYISGSYDVIRPMFWLLDRPEHDRDIRMKANGMSRFVALKPLFSGDLVWAQNISHFIVKYFSSSSWQGLKTSFF